MDRLLASPHYGERWARPWLDLARYADSHGFEKDLPRVMWKYRDWVIDALNRDMPFDRFTIEQIAGDMLPNATPEQIVASGFHRNAMTNEEGGTDPDESLYEVLVDRVNTTATVWLGTTLGCAQCHNHKYDPFSQKDYYRLMAFFSNSDYEVRTFGDGTRFFEARHRSADARAGSQTEDDSSADRSAERRAEDRDARARAAQAVVGAGDATRGVVCVVGADAEEPLGNRRREVERRARRIGDRRGRKPGRDDLHDRSRFASERERSKGLPRVTAIRLEALPDPSLPKGGPGRDPYGNFQLNGFEVDAGGSRLAFSAIKADESAGGASLDTFFPKTLSRDVYAPRGWRIDASRQDTRLPKQIVFTLDRPWTAAGRRR